MPCECEVSALCLLFAASLAQQRLWTGTSPRTLQLFHVHYTPGTLILNEVVDIFARKHARRLTVVDILNSDGKHCDLNGYT